MYDILSGRDEVLLGALAMGAKGAVGSTYNYSGRIYNSLIKAFNEGDMDGALRYQRMSQVSIDILLSDKYGVGVNIGKAIMELRLGGKHTGKATMLCVLVRRCVRVCANRRCWLSCVCDARVDTRYITAGYTYCTLTRRSPAMAALVGAVGQCLHEWSTVMLRLHPVALRYARYSPPRHRLARSKQCTQVIASISVASMCRVACRGFTVRFFVCAGPPRYPVREMTEESKSALRDDLSAIGFFEW